MQYYDDPTWPREHNNPYAVPESMHEGAYADVEFAEDIFPDRCADDAECPFHGSKNCPCRYKRKPMKGDYYVNPYYAGGGIRNYYDQCD